MATAMTPGRPPFPPFTRDSAMQKVRLMEHRSVCCRLSKYEETRRDSDGWYD
jgi:hypothetical protein